MPGRIVILPETLTHRIAAGEVVERPASIVKELLENALDAGATEIVVELEKGGCQSVRITDNGEGIDREDVPLAFARYATSKIGVFEDIYRVRSFGFRGEALPSIASISRAARLIPGGHAGDHRVGRSEGALRCRLSGRHLDPRQPDLRDGSGPQEIPQGRCDGTGVLPGRDHPAGPGAEQG
jgi:hypothetical protein